MVKIIFGKVEDLWGEACLDIASEIRVDSYYCWFFSIFGIYLAATFLEILAGSYW